MMGSTVPAGAVQATYAGYPQTVRAVLNCGSPPSHCSFPHRVRIGHELRGGHFPADYTSFSDNMSFFYECKWFLLVLTAILGVILVVMTITVKFFSLMFLAFFSTGQPSVEIVPFLLFVTFVVLLVLVLKGCMGDDDDLLSGLDFGGGGTARSFSYTPTDLRGKPREPGATGLQNLGNTCYMNSTIQCLSQVPELTALLVSDEYEQWLNRENVMGTKGVVTDAYADLMKKLWSGDYTAVAPTAFRSALTARATQFAGYLQHDSQELLACLLDYLHEDMNQSRLPEGLPRTRLLLPDAESKSDPDDDATADDDLPPPAPGVVRKASVTGTRAWESRTGLNDSVVSNTFQGQLRDYMQCPQCKHESVNFSFVQYLTLPLPALYRTVTVRVVPWIDPSTLDGTDASVPTLSVAPVVMYSVRVPRNGCIGDVCFAVRKDANLSPNVALVAVDVTRGMVARTFRNTDSIAYVYPERLVLYVGPPDIPEDDPRTLTMLVMMHRRSVWSLLHQQYHHRMEAFGMPYVFLTMGTPTYAEAALVGKRWRFLCLDLLASGVGDMPLEAFGSGEDTLQLKLSLVDTWGASCAVCPYNSDCKGCGLPDVPASKWDPGCRMGMDWVTAGDKSFADDFDAIRDRVHEAKSPEAKRAPWPDKFYHVNAYGLEALPIVVWSENVPGPAWLLPTTAEQLSAALTIPAPEPDTTKVTLAECLDHFQAEEVLGEDNLWLCPGCDTKVAASKGLQLWRAPPVLIIHLKRFTQSMFQESAVKNDTQVEFPVNGFDLAPWLHCPGVPKDMLLYDCFAVSNHTGSIAGGHYTAYTKSCMSAEWSLFNDSRVTVVGDPVLAHTDPDAYSESVESKLQTASAYVLMYRRRGNIPMGSMQLLMSHLPQPADPPSPTASLASTAIEDDAAVPKPEPRTAASAGAPAAAAAPSAPVTAGAPAVAAAEPPQPPPPDVEAEVGAAEDHRLATAEAVAAMMGSKSTPAPRRGLRQRRRRH